MGFGIGGDYVMSPVIMAENANAKDRGKLMATTFSIMLPNPRYARRIGKMLMNAAAEILSINTFRACPLALIKPEAVRSE